MAVGYNLPIYKHRYPHIGSCTYRPNRPGNLRNQFTARVVEPRNIKEATMKGIIAYLLGVPFVIIVLLYLTDVF